MCGSFDSRDELIPEVYEELRRMAAAQMNGERAQHTLQPTALVHEVYLRLLGTTTDWESRRHFFGAAAEAMRRVLIDHARTRNRAKRGGGRRACASRTPRPRPRPTVLSTS